MGRENRQQVLDLLWATPLALSAKDLATIVNEPNHKSMSARLKRMVEEEELSCEVRRVKGTRVNFYRPVVKTTKDVYPPTRWEVAMKAKLETGDSEALPPQKVKSQGPWHIVHYGTHRDHPIKTCGGQGSMVLPRGFSAISKLEG